MNLPPVRHPESVSTVERNAERLEGRSHLHPDRLEFVFWMVWFNGERVYERLFRRCPTTNFGHRRVENLRTGQILADTLDFRQQVAIARGIQAGAFSKRDRVLSKLNGFKLKG